MPAPLIVNFHMPIDAPDREVLAELQSMLVKLIDLALIGKQAHWNVEGPHFRSLHLELDELVDTWRSLGDQVAEREVTFGAVPDGQAATSRAGTGSWPATTSMRARARAATWVTRSATSRITS